MAQLIGNRVDSAVKEEGLLEEQEEEGVSNRVDSAVSEAGLLESVTAQKGAFKEAEEEEEKAVTARNKAFSKEAEEEGKEFKDGQAFGQDVNRSLTGVAILSIATYFVFIVLCAPSDSLAGHLGLLLFPVGFWGGRVIGGGLCQPSIESLRLIAGLYVMRFLRLII